MTTRTAALTVTDLKAWYGQARALFGVDLAVRPGQVVGVLGHNGAGKTTLLRSIAGVHRSRSGDVRQFDTDLMPLSADQVARSGLSLVREGAKVFDSMTVAENLALGRQLARRRGAQPPPVESVVDVFPALRDRMSIKGALLSGGQRQMLSLARALLSRPTVLLLDEPSAGLAPVVAREVFNAVRVLAEGGVALLLTEQNSHWLRGIADTVYLLESGRVARSGSLEEVVGA
jgi:branched-chain amino acid transport system ATP-binding protein